jgi:hypothetical protein
MKKLFVALAPVVLAGALAAAGQTRTFTGVITDTMCGADHSAMGEKPDSKCVRDCVKMDKSIKFALYDGAHVYTLSDQVTPDKYAAQKVKVTGVLNQKTGVIQVEKIEPAK